MITIRHFLAMTVTGLAAVCCNAQQADLEENAEVEEISEWEDLLDPELSKWEKWLKEPLGLNNDPSNVYTVIDEGGVPVLAITGEIYGGLTTVATYSNYHFQAKVKWGEKKWPPRLERKRDSGICYHCYGPHGAHGGSWKACLEYQVQEKDMGDFIPLAKTEAEVRVRPDPTLQDRHWRFDPTADFRKVDWYVHCEIEPDFPNGEWNTLDLYVIDDMAIHLVNGKFVCALRNAVKNNGESLVEGQIQLQSEAAEIFYKEIRIKGIKEFPAPLKEAAGF